METEKNEIQKRFAITTQERNSLENQIAELQDLNRLERQCSLYGLFLLSSSLVRYKVEVSKRLVMLCLFCVSSKETLPSGVVGLPFPCSKS